MNTCDLPASPEGTALATDDESAPNQPFTKSAMAYSYDNTRLVSDLGERVVVEVPTRRLRGKLAAV